MYDVSGRRFDISSGYWLKNPILQLFGTTEVLCLEHNLLKYWKVFSYLPSYRYIFLAYLF